MKHHSVVMKYGDDSKQGVDVFLEREGGVFLRTFVKTMSHYSNYYHNMIGLRLW